MVCVAPAEDDSAQHRQLQGMAPQMNGSLENDSGAANAAAPQPAKKPRIDAHKSGPDAAAAAAQHGSRTAGTALAPGQAEAWLIGQLLSMELLKQGLEQHLHLQIQVSASAPFLSHSCARQLPKPSC